MEICCSKCAMRTEMRSPRDLVACPDCGAGLRRRRRPSPGPLTHGPLALLSLFSVGGLFTLAVYVGLGWIPFPIVPSFVAALFLAHIGVRFAFRAMSTETGAIEFPTLSEDLFDLSSLPIAIGYFVVFELLPILALLFGGIGIALLVAFTSEMIASVALVGFAAALVAVIAYAPIGLVLYLQTGSVWSLLNVSQGLRMVADLPLRSLTLIVLTVGIRVVGFGLLIWVSFGATNPGLVLSMILGPLVTAVTTLMTYALCGLFVRQNARELDVPCDESDFVPFVPRPQLEGKGEGFVVTPRLNPSPLTNADQYTPPAEDPFAPRAREASAYQPIDLPAVTGTMSLTGDVLVHSADVATAPSRRVPWAELPVDPEAFDARRHPAPVPLAKPRTTSPAPRSQWLDAAFDAPQTQGRPASTTPELSWPPRLAAEATTGLSPTTDPAIKTPSAEGVSS